MSWPKGSAWGLQAWIALRRSRPSAMLGAALCAGGLAAWSSLQWPAGDAAADLRLALAQSRAQLRATASPPVAAPSATDQRLSAFYTRLGEPGAAEAHLGRVFELARKTELDLAQGEYKWLVDQAAGTERYQLRLPIKGPYGAVRLFIERVLRELPFASLDELSLQRQDIGEDSLSAVLQFSLHLHPGAISAVAAPAGLPVGGAEPRR